MCVLLGYGADAICPYLVFETMSTLRAEGVVNSSFTDKEIFKVGICYRYVLSNTGVDI